jgi:excisionase family DNA binding protein
MGQSPESPDPLVMTGPSHLRLVKSTRAPGTPEVVAQFLTRSKVAGLLGVSPRTVTRWAREGRLACQVTLGGHYRFDRGLVERLRGAWIGREAGSDGAA